MVSTDWILAPFQSRKAQKKTVFQIDERTELLRRVRVYFIHPVTGPCEKKAQAIVEPGDA